MSSQRTGWVQNSPERPSLGPDRPTQQPSYWGLESGERCGHVGGIQPCGSEGSQSAVREQCCGREQKDHSQQSPPMVLPPQKFPQGTSHQPGLGGGRAVPLPGSCSDQPVKSIPESSADLWMSLKVRLCHRPMIYRPHHTSHFLLCTNVLSFISFFNHERVIADS